MLLRSLLLTFIFVSAGAAAQTRLTLQDSVSQQLIADPRIDGAYAVDANMGWLVTAMQLECTSHEVTTPGNELPKSKDFNCYVRPLVRFSQNPNATNIEITDQGGLKQSLLNTMYREGYQLMISKMTVAYGGNITCMVPAATGNPQDKASCELWK